MINYNKEVEKIRLDTKIELIKNSISDYISGLYFDGKISYREVLGRYHFFINDKNGRPKLQICITNIDNMQRLKQEINVAIIGYDFNATETKEFNKNNILVKYILKGEFCKTGIVNEINFLIKKHIDCKMKNNNCFPKKFKRIKKIKEIKVKIEEVKIELDF
jgi:hypothetical protein